MSFRRPTSGLLENDSMRIVITAPNKDLLLQEDDVAFMLVQYEENEEEASSMYTGKSKWGESRKMSLNFENYSIQEQEM